MSTDSLPPDISNWSDSLKQSVLLRLAQELVGKSTSGSFPLVIGSDPSAPFYLVSPIQSSKEFRFDGSSDLAHELQRRRHLPTADLEQLLDRLANDPR